MKKILFILVVLSISWSMKADTLDYFVVKYNDSTFNSFNSFGDNIPVLKKHNVQVHDILGIQYFSDTPCWDCGIYIVITDIYYRIMKVVKGGKSFDPIRFGLNDLAKRAGLKRPAEFYVFYLENNGNLKPEKRLLFQLNLE